MRGKTRATDAQVRAVVARLYHLGLPLINVLENKDLDIGDRYPIRVHIAVAAPPTPNGRHYRRFHVVNRAGRHLGWDPKRRQLFGLFPPGLIQIPVDGSKTSGKRWEALLEWQDLSDWLYDTAYEAEAA